MRIKSPLANFTDTLSQVKDSAERYTDTLQDNESSTRAVLIDPILRILGWDIANPFMVEVEKSIDQGFVDYALYGENREIQIIIEAKKLGTNLEDKDIFLSLVKYAFSSGIADIFLTDGLIWNHFTDFSPGSQEPIKVLSLKNDELVEIASYLVHRLDAARYWPEAKDVDELSQQLNQLESEVIEIQLELARLKPQLMIDRRKNGDELLDSEQPQIEIPKEFTLLQDIDDAKGTKPTALLLPDGTQVRVNSWTTVLAQCCKYTLDKKSDIHVPFKDVAGRKVDLIALTPPPKRTSQFLTEYNGQQVFVYTNYDANTIVRNSIYILKQLPESQMKTKPAVIYN